MHSLPRKRTGSILLLTAAGLLLSCRPEPGPLRQLERILAKSDTRLTPRLSVSRGSRRGTRPLPARQLSELVGSVRQSPGVDGLHVTALVDLLFPGPDGAYALRAVRQLRAALEIEPASAALLSDLAAAHLVWAEHGGTLLDLQQAVDACERALELEPGYPAALFNLALALDSMALDGQAVSAWTRAATGRASDWTREAARRRSLLTAPRPPWRRSADSLAWDAARAPQEARLFAMDTLLGRWGDAVLAGDSAAAAANLRDAHTIGEALRGRGGDLTVADLVQAIRTHADDPAATLRLARAHSLYASSQPMVAQRDSSALAHLDSARDAATRSRVLELWSRYWHAVAMWYARRPGSAEGFDSLNAVADSVRHPALMGRVRWSQGTLQLRPASYTLARDRFVEAQRFFTRAGEVEHWGAVQELEGEALFGLNDEPGAHDRMRSALRALRPYRSSQWLHNLLYTASQIATARGLNHAALRMQEEGVLVASRQRPLVHVEALLVRARTLTAAGRFAAAERDLAKSREILAAANTTWEHEWQVHHLYFAEAGLWVQSRPRRAVAMLDSVVAYFGSPRGAPSRVVAALATRAEAHLALGDAPSAAAALDSAAAQVHTLSAGVRDIWVRAMVLEKARHVFDRLLMLHVRAGRVGEALTALERGRAAFGPAAAAGDSAALSAPEGQVALDFAVVGDTLLTFVVQGGRVWMVEDTVSRDVLLGAVARATTALEVRAPLDSIRPPLAILHRHLFAPVAARAPAGTRLVIVADGELADVPFAALWDGERRRYLLQDHPLRFAATLADARRPLPPADPAAPEVFVADPAFDPAEFPGLQRLPETAAAALQIARATPGAHELVGSAAGLDSVLAALSTARLFHFAGHAIFDPDRPAASFLVLAPAHGKAGSVTAAELERLNLRRVRLVVLSACQTQRSATGRAGGFIGLSGAILAGGAGGVVGSLWRVDDALTRALMDEFHRAYRDGDAAAALRSAQLRLLSSPDPALRSPAAWAGFRYMGG